MTPVELYDFIENDDELNGICVDGGRAIISNTINSMITAVDVNELKDINWHVLRDVIIGRREPIALNHMTRVVGYYSRIENFNRSKIGELKDRIRGNYGIDGFMSDSDVRSDRLAAAESI